MWNKPQFMTVVADLLLLAGSAALLVAALSWGAHLPWFPLREVVVVDRLQEIRRDDLELALAGRLRGNFFSIELDEVRHALQQLPWVRQVSVRRQWPSRLEVSIEEHVAAAHWRQGPEPETQDEEDDSGQLVNTYGEIFTAALREPPAIPLPLLSGPPGLAPQILGYYQQAADVLKTVGRMPHQIVVSPRLAVQVRLADGMLLELGRQQPEIPLRELLQRFVDYYPSVANAGKAPPEVVDMRYPNGFALRLAAASVSNNKGKP
ncbi:MAG: FtsQ-type POTRA domain-containing protein [Propionivibrio sp.]